MATLDLLNEQSRISKLQYLFKMQNYADLKCCREIFRKCLISKDY